MMPFNKSPELIPVGTGRSAVAGSIVAVAWLSFFR